MSFPSDDAATTTPGTSRGFVLRSDEGEAFWWLGSLTLTKVTRQVTGGDLDIVDHRIPAGYAPPLHVHRHQDEVFYVIDGTFAVHCGDEDWEAGPGSLVFLPRQVPHGFVVSEDEPGRTLLINAPAGFADVVTVLGTRTDNLVLPGPDLPIPDPDRLTAVSERHGIFNA